MMEFRGLIKAFTLVELLVAASITAVLAALLAGAGWNVYKTSSLAVSASNIRQLSAGGSAYLADNNYVFWNFREERGTNGTVWWYGYETSKSVKFTPEGERSFDPGEGPLAGYVPAGLRPDPSFAFAGKAFKPKYRSGYLGIGYNIHLGGGWVGSEANKRFWDLPNPGQIVVFSTAAQVNTFLPPASQKNPMIEEFPGLNDWESTVHFRHRGYAMVGFANGSAGFLPMDRSTLDPRAPKAEIGRFAPKGSRLYLLPATNL